MTRVLFLSGPSGIGKSTAAAMLVANRTFVRLPPVMTRPARIGEQHGTNAWFYDDTTFASLVASGDLFASTSHLGGKYAYRKADRDNAAASNQSVVLETYAPRVPDLRTEFGTGLALYLRPDCVDWLRGRLIDRGAAPADIERRVEAAHDEMAWYDGGGCEHFEDAIVLTPQSSPEWLLERIVSYL